MRPRRVLVVDDSPEVRLLMKKYAEDNSFNLDATGSGKEALSLFLAKTYNLVFLDLFLEEGQSGFKIFSEMKDQAGRLGLSWPPVVALSASSFPEDKEKCLALGFETFVQKPFRRSDIMEIFRRYLRAEPPPSGQAGLDPDVIEMQPAYIRNREKDLSVMRSAWSGGNLAAVGAIAHRVKGSAGAFGFNNLGEIAGRIESLAGEGDGEGTGRALAEFEDVLGTLRPSAPGLKKAEESEKID
jgi:CheY-like chemotaxis protein/HPt (histidine-containing phosphotransfer) domain-containing protein